MVGLEEDVAEPYSNLCDSLGEYVPEKLKGEPSKALEWLSDRSNLLAEVEDELANTNHPGDVDDAIKDMIGTLAQAEDILKVNGWAKGDFLEGLQALADRAPPMEYDL